MDYNKFITFTLNPLLHRFKARTQMKRSFERVASLLKTVCDKFYMVAELTKKGNIHYHCMAVYNESEYDESAFIVDMCKDDKILGQIVDIQTIKDFDKTMAYLKKDIEKTYHIINRKKEIIEISKTWIKKKCILRVYNAIEEIDEL